MPLNGTLKSRNIGRGSRIERVPYKTVRNTCVLLETDPETFWQTDHYRNYPAVLARFGTGAEDRIALYIQRYRPVLLEGPTDHLFPGKCNGAKQRAHLAKQISDTIRKRTGLIVNAHLFRHIAAMSYLDANPGAYGVVRLLQGDSTLVESFTGPVERIVTIPPGEYQVYAEMSMNLAVTSSAGLSANVRRP